MRRAGWDDVAAKPRFSKRQLLVRRRLADLALRALTPEEMAHAMLAALSEAVPADHGGIGTLDPGTLLLNRVLALWSGTERSAPVVDRLKREQPGVDVTLGHLASLFFDEVYLHDPEPAMLHPSLLRAGLHAVVVGRQPEKSLGLPGPYLQAAFTGRSRDWYEATQPVGGTLRAGLCVEGRHRVSMAFGRDDPDAAFRPSEVAFVRSASSVMARGIRLAVNRQAASLQALENGSLTPGVMLLDRSHRAVYVSPAARRWLELLESVERIGERVLPTAVEAAVAALRAALFAEEASIVRLETAVGWLRVEAADGGDGHTAVILSPERRVDAPSAPNSWPLTRQEQQVVSCVLAGSSSRQIADTLGLASTTIKSHLAHVYEKLGVSGRGGLLARYLREELMVDRGRGGGRPRT